MQRERLHAEPRGRVISNSLYPDTLDTLRNLPSSISRSRRMAGTEREARRRLSIRLELFSSWLVAHAAIRS